MQFGRIFPRGSATCLMVVVLLSSTGCLGFLHPVTMPSQDLLNACLDIPAPGRHHVYVFLVNGLDPTNYGNLQGVREYLHQLGYIKTYYGQWFHTPWFRDEICSLAADDPDARFVLVGFSLGAKGVRDLAHQLHERGVFVDLLVYVDGVTLRDEPENVPENVGKVIHLVGDASSWRAVDIAGAENYHLPQTRHFGTPTHVVTLETLATELMEVASRVPVSIPSQQEEMPRLEETSPPPRPVQPSISRKRDAWDFLKPVTSLINRPEELRYESPALANKPRTTPIRNLAERPAPIKRQGTLMKQKK
ncbi:MAG: hypothetical protein KatS3mg105_0275 [Gemmatales bacterium]|nr:MAG: hypothetical protein KatS3mg105_0275 [Gemmatales bacterium]